MAGTPNGRRMAEYRMAMMTEAGVAAQMHELPGLVSFPRRTTLEVLGSPPVTMAAMTLGHSETTPPEGTIGELIDIGGGGLPDYDGRDVAGKIVVPDPGATRSSASPRCTAPSAISASIGAMSPIRRCLTVR
jgi:hypothetical protein